MDKKDYKNNEKYSASEFREQVNKNIPKSKVNSTIQELEKKDVEQIKKLLKELDGNSLDFDAALQKMNTQLSIDIYFDQTQDEQE